MSRYQRAYDLLASHLSSAQQLELKDKCWFREGEFEVMAYKGAGNIVCHNTIYCVSWDIDAYGGFRPAADCPPVLDLALGIVMLIRTERLLDIALIYEVQLHPERRQRLYAANRARASNYWHNHATEAAMTEPLQVAQHATGP